MQLEFLDFGRAPDPIDIHSLTSTQDGRRSDQESTYVTFRMSGVDNSFANGLRRVLLAEIPTLAFTVVELEINTSVFHDEFMTHRIGLVPVISPFHEQVDAMPMPQECACNQDYLQQGNVSYRMGCDACHLKCYFDVMCPPHLESVDFTSADLISEDPRLRIAVGKGSKVYLAKLGRGQRIRGVAYAKKGIAKQHSRHMAVGTVSYRYDADIALNHTGLADLTDENRQLWVSRCPAGVFDLVDGIVTMPRVDKCIMCRECLATEAPFDDLPAPLVSVRNKRTANGGFSVLMRVESVGHMGAVDCVRVALIILRRKMEGVRKALEIKRGAALDGASGGGGGGAAAAAGAGGAHQGPTASSVIIGGNLNDNENDLLRMAEKNPQMWG